MVDDDVLVGIYEAVKKRLCDNPEQWCVGAEGIDEHGEIAFYLFDKSHSELEKLAKISVPVAIRLESESSLEEECAIGYLGSGIFERLSTAWHPARDYWQLQAWNDMKDQSINKIRMTIDSAIASLGG